jgi:hypothetical protein
MPWGLKLNSTQFGRRGRSDRRAAFPLRDGAASGTIAQSLEVRGGLNKPTPQRFCAPEILCFLSTSHLAIPVARSGAVEYSERKLDELLERDHRALLTWRPRQRHPEKTGRVGGDNARDRAASGTIAQSPGVRGGLNKPTPQVRRGRRPQPSSPSLVRSGSTDGGDTH